MAVIGSGRPQRALHIALLPTGYDSDNATTLIPMRVSDKLMRSRGACIESLL